MVCSCERPSDSDEATDGSAGVAECAELDLLSQVGCYADLAEESGELGPCESTTHEGVLHQCYAVVAERRDDPRICQQIPSTTTEHLSLRDLCLSDIAKNRLDPELCGAVETVGFRDGCYFTVAEGVPDSKLCSEITDEGLQRLCIEGPSQ